MGVIWFPSSGVRIGFLLVVLHTFHWQTGAKFCQEEGRGVGRGLATWKLGKACMAPFPEYTKRGLGKLAPLLSVGDGQGGRWGLSCLSNRG